MHTVSRPPEGPLTLLHLPSGTVHFFTDRAAAARGLRALNVERLVGETPPFPWNLDDMRSMRYADWRLTNVYNEKLVWTDLPPPRKAATRWFHRLPAWEVGVYRRDPVSGAGSYSQRAHRHPRTLALMREAASREDTEAPVRSARGLTAIPTAWEDIYRRTERSWKRHRRTRWKV